MAMVVMMVVLSSRQSNRARPSGGKGDVNLLACPASDELDSMIDHSAGEKSLQILLDGLDTARKRNDERILDCARNRSRQRSERRVFQRHG